MFDNFFKFKENGTDFKTEIIAGITTFLAMAYILGVNPVILADGGMPATGVFFATAVASGIACIIMGLVAKYPVGLAPFRFKGSYLKCNSFRFKTRYWCSNRILPSIFRT